MHLGLTFEALYRESKHFCFTLRLYIPLGVVFALQLELIPMQVKCTGNANDYIDIL